MPKLDKWLEKDFDDLVSMATKALATSREAQDSARPAVEAFYRGLIDASRQIDPTPLHLVLRDWVESRSAPIEGETARFLPVLQVLKRVTVEMAVERNSPADAVSMLVLLNNSLGDATVFLGEQETEATLRDMWQELESAQEAIQKLDKSKTDFISVAAHELRTPLTIIEGYVNMLNQEFPADQFPNVALMLGGIANGTTRLREIIDNMIDVSKIDMDLLELHMQPVWLNRLIEIVVEELASAAEYRNITIAVSNFADQNRPVFGDPERLHQVFRNVIVNAIKYTPDGGEIAVDVKRLPEFFDVRVVDTGIGIAADDLPRLFEKLAPIGDVALHSSSQTSFKGGGPGLGLAIAKGIMEAHGGNIWAESPGYDEEACPGSTFHIMVPVRSSAAQKAARRNVAVEQLFESVESDSGGPDR